MTGNRCLPGASKIIRGVPRVCPCGCLPDSAHTIANLDGSDSVHEQHIAEAIQYCSLDRKTP